MSETTRVHAGPHKASRACDGGRVQVGLLDGVSFRHASRRLFADAALPADARVVAVEPSNGDGMGQLIVRNAEPKIPTESVDADHVTLTSLAYTVLQREPVAVAVLLCPGSLGDERLDHAISSWLDAGVDVFLVAADRLVRDETLIRYAELRPLVRLHHGAHREDVNDLLDELVGDVTADHGELISQVVRCNVSLALLFATALEPWLGQGRVPTGAVHDALAVALAKQIRVLADTDDEQALAFIHAVIGSSQALDSAAALLGVGADRALDLRAALIFAGVGTGDQIRRDLTVEGLLRLLPRTTVDRAILTLSDVLVEVDLDPDTCLGVLASVRGTEIEAYTRLVHDTVESVPRDQRPAVLSRLLPLLTERPSDPVRRVVTVLRHDNIHALRAPILAATQSGQLADPLSGLSLLVALEHPDAVADWAQRVLQAPECDPAVWAKAAMVWPLVARSNGSQAQPNPQVTRAMARRTANLDPATRRLVDIVHTCAQAFTMRSDECAVIEVASTVDDLRLDHLHADLGCLTAAACFAVDDIELADRWSWLVRAYSAPDSLDHGCAQLIKAFCCIRTGDVERALENAEHACHTLERVGAVALTALAAVTVSYCRRAGGAERPLPPIPVDSHPLLVSAHHYLAARMSIDQGDRLDAVNVLFDVGRRLRSAGLDNPGIVRWRQHLVALFDELDEPQIAECLRTDLLRADTAWRERNPRSGKRRLDTPDPEPTGDGVEPGRLDALSESELRVVERVVAGDTNPEAAAALFLSKRTIDTHLRNIYRRLGITSRAELRALADAASPLSPDREGAPGPKHEGEAGVTT